MENKEQYLNFKSKNKVVEMAITKMIYNDS